MAETKKEKHSKIKPVHVLAVVIILAAIIGVIYMATSNAATPVVATGDNVSVYYTGTLVNGTVFDTNVGKEALNFTVGSGQLIQGFDQGVIGMKLNQTKTITLTANEAYGAVNPALIVTVPRSQFGNESVSVGMAVSTSSGQQGLITALNATNATVDFNPPLAGQTLIFKITVVSIKK
jgi:FKBP-type peptidyl-prolyl cis-trans isomerase 2